MRFDRLGSQLRAGGDVIFGMAASQAAKIINIVRDDAAPARRASSREQTRSFRFIANGPKIGRFR
jgi:hypothetical protein